MDALIINFEKIKQEHVLRQKNKKEQIIFECQKEINSNEEQIRSLVIQINQLQSNIDLNLQLISRLNATSHSHRL